MIPKKTINNLTGVIQVKETTICRINGSRIASHKGIILNQSTPRLKPNGDSKYNFLRYSSFRRVGSEVMLHVTGNPNTYLYLVDVDPAGKVTVLFPNSFSKDNYLKASLTYKMPAPNHYRMQVSGPAGPELVKAIATAKPLKIDILAADKGDFTNLGKSAVEITRTILDQLKREINRSSTRGIVVLPALDVEKPIATEGWASDNVFQRVLEKKNN
ncbi:MAG: DUF4384 domain-containing protein [bacterium]